MVQGSGERLSEQERLAILAELEAPRVRSVRAIARAFRVDESAIRQLWKKRSIIRDRTQGVAPTVLNNRLRFQPAAHAELEQRLLAWITKMRKHKLPVPPSLACVKALSYAKELNISTDNFAASPGWFQAFRRRHSLVTMLLHGEAAEIDQNDPALIEKLNDFSAIVSTYKSSCVFNMDETGLFTVFCRDTHCSRPTKTHEVREDVSRQKTESALLFVQMVTVRLKFLV
ncbi:hypothetical protein LEN26_001539 [Aphanomyces euteiches]|nr:hypothetical protein LEN26_001539 [Aphanomyces euteiches]